MDPATDKEYWYSKEIYSLLSSIRHMYIELMLAKQDHLIYSLMKELKKEKELLDHGTTKDTKATHNTQVNGKWSCHLCYDIIQKSFIDIKIFQI